MTQPQVGSADPASGGTSPRQRVVALVVTFNRLAQLQTTVARLLDEDVDAVVVVNNASTDGTADFLAAIQDPRLYPVTLDRQSRRRRRVRAGVESGDGAL